MQIVALFIESNTAIAATQMNKLNDISCISLGWLNYAVLGKEIEDFTVADAILVVGQIRPNLQWMYGKNRDFDAR